MAWFVVDQLVAYHRVVQLVGMEAVRRDQHVHHAPLDPARPVIMVGFREDGFVLEMLTVPPIPLFLCLTLHLPLDDPLHPVARRRRLETTRQMTMRTTTTIPIPLHLAVCPAKPVNPVEDELQAL